MEILDFQLQHPFLFHWNGKFLAPDENWVHLTRNLGDFELVVMTEGTLYIGEGDQEYVVQKGEYRIICPTPYQHGTHPSFCSFFWIHFAYNEEKNDPLRYTADTFHPVGEDEARILLPVQAKVPRLDRLTVELNFLQDCYQRYHNPTLNNYILSSLLCELYHQLCAEQEMQKRTHGKDKHLFSDIQDYVSWHIHDPIKISDIASYFDYNPKYITTYFKKIAGMPLKQYILTQKVDASKAMLSDTNRSISEISYDLGFSDSRSFSAAFRNLTGQSPSEYRNTFPQRMVFRK